MGLASAVEFDEAPDPVVSIARLKASASGAPGACACWT
jgi:hypothetical protein